MSITCLSGNELFCLAQKGYKAENLILGSSVYASSFIETLGGGKKTTLGRELSQASLMAREGWQKAFQKMTGAGQVPDSASVIAIQYIHKHYPGFQEFLVMGSVISALDSNKAGTFTAAADGQELYALLDAGYQPKGFTFGNVVYATALTQSLYSSFKAFARGEIKEFSELLGQARQSALEQIVSHAASQEANAVLGIKAAVFSFGKACELLMTGTACYKADLQSSAATELVTSSLTIIETWNLARLGYAPLGVVMGTTVYSLGLKSSTISSLKPFFRGESNELASLMQEARKKILDSLQTEAKKKGADEVVAVKTYVYSLGYGLYDFFAIGTAVKKVPSIKTESEQLPSQVLAIDETSLYNWVGNIDKGSPLTTVLRLATVIFIVLFFAWLKIKN